MNRSRRFTIRARLVIGSVIVAAIIFALALGLVRTQTNSILDSANLTLASDDLTSYASEIVANPGDLVDDSGKGILIYVRNPQGRVELNTLPPEIGKQVANKNASDATFDSSVGRMRFVVVGRVVHTSTGDWSLWAARSAASSELAQHGLDRVFLLAGLVLLVLFAAASWVLASSALRPVERMRKKADQLSLDGTEMLPAGRVQDELTDLATTLNQFLTRVRESTVREKQVVSDAAHELRTPLAALTTQLELATDHFDDAPALAAQVVAAQKSVARLTSLTTNLLELSRLEAAPGHPIFTPIDSLVTELMGCVDRARFIGQNPEVDISFAVHGDRDEVVVAVSAENFGRVVDNLVSNSISAIHRRPPGEISGDRRAVTISLSTTASTAVLIVSDTGPGMDPGFMPHAFERFSRPDDSRTAATGGSGLGLALVQAIVSAARGTVTLTNTDSGLDVIVTFPKM
jgi:two-component system OmpR family sensor kinase